MSLTSKGNSKGLPRSKVILSWSSLTLGIICFTCAALLCATDLILIVTSYRMKVSNNSLVHKVLSKPLDGVHVAAYLFNITNADRFMAGEDQNLIVHEVGPFTYKEVRYNDNLDIDVGAGVIRYEPRLETELIPEKSVAHPDDVMVTMPNLPMLGFASMLSSYSYWTQTSFNVITNQLNSKPLVTTNASTYLWGYDEPLVTLGHTFMPGFVYFDKMGILDRLYDNDTPNKLEVSAKEEDKFMIKTRNGHKKLSMGDDDDCEICDDFTNSYEGLGYPSPTTPEMPIKVFRKGLCRLLPMDFHEKVVFENGVEGLVFNLSDSFYALDPNDTSGLLDLHKCFFGLPLALSKVKFLGMDPKVYERVEGIQPDPTKEGQIVIESKIATELKTYFPVQFNLKLEDLSYNSKAAPFSNMVLPIGYLEVVQQPLPEETQHALHNMYVIYPAVLLATKALLILCGIVLMCYPIAVVKLHKSSIASQARTQELVLDEKCVK